MRSAHVALLALAALAGCSSVTAMDLTIQLGGDAAARAPQLASLLLQVDGDAAPFSRAVDVHGKFGSGQETLQYLPGVQSGTLTFNVTLSDDAGVEIASGSASQAVKAHASVALVVPIGAVDTDAGVSDMAAADLAGGGSGPDLAMMPCTQLQVSTLAGTGAAGEVDGPGATAQFTMAEGITVDPQGTLYVAEASRVRKVLADGTTSTFAMTGILQGRRVSRSNVGELYVADSANDALLRVSTGGTVSTLFNLGGIIAGAANQMNGKAYVSETQLCSLWVTNASNMPVIFSGSASGACGFQDGAAASAKFSGAVWDLVFDAAGVLYVADGGNFRIRKVATDGSVITLAGSTQGHVDGVGAAAQFDGPTGIAIDDQQHLVYVADGTTIRVITASGGVSTLVGSTSGFVDGNGCVAKFGALHGITWFAGSLYAVDVERIRKIILP